MNLDVFDASKVNQLLKEMSQAAESVVKPAMEKGKPKLTIKADCRYVGQGHEIQIAIPMRVDECRRQKLKAEFEKAYKSVYGLTIPLAG